MRKIILPKMCSVSLLFVSLVLTADNVAAYVWQQYNGHYYTLTTTYSNWSNAEAEAQAVGGHLVTINDAAENIWLQSSFANTYAPIGIDPTGNDPTFAAAWIGYYWNSTAEDWQWISGQPVTYTNYYYMWYLQPLDNYAFMAVDPNPATGAWHAHWVHSNFPDYYFRGIIEVGHNPVPAPPALWLLGSGLLGFVAVRKKLCG